MIPIDTPRLVLEPVDRENLAILRTIMNAPHLRQYQDVPRVPIMRFSERLLRRSPVFKRGSIGRFEWLIRPRVLTEAIGWASIRMGRKDSPVGELGYSIVMEARRRGYAAEAVTAVMDESFRRGVVDRIEACCMLENLASRKVLERIGLIERRILKRGAVVRGQAVDIVLYDIDRSSWMRRPASQTISRAMNPEERALKSETRASSSDA